MSLVLDFTNPLAGQPELSGGKGANLSLLTQRGFAVPPGFVVSAMAYREFMRHAKGVLQAVDQFNYDSPAELLTQAQTLRDQLRQIPLIPELVEQVRALYAQFSAGTAVSVRSSSTFEDLAGAAFAGQHDTFLNCTSFERVLECIRDCFISIWQDRAIMYRQKMGFDHHAAAMAVVVQTMVHAEVAGVGFSVNPIAGKLDEMLINANYGLGESVVSGDGEIDQFVLSKTDGAVRSSSIGCKSHCVMSAAQGVVEHSIDANKANESCLSESQLAQLAQLMRDVEKSYQFPQDIEWAMAGGQLYLLQSRPVTTIAPRWSRDESAERFPTVITPLTWDFVEEGFHRSLNHSFELMGYPKFSGKWFGMHGHYIYGNQNAVDLYASRVPFSIRSIDDLEKQLPQLAQQFSWVQELPLEWSRELDHYLLRIGEFMAEPLEGQTLAQVWEFVRKVNQLGSDYFLPNIAISLTQRTLYRVLMGVLTLALKDQKQATQTFDTLMAWCETKTGVINKELYEIAASIRASSALQQLLDANTSRELLASGKLAAFPQFEARFNKFLRDHGHREVDFDPYHATWLESPWIVLDNLRLISHAAQGAAEPGGKERELKIKAQEAEFHLLSSIPRSLHFFFSELLRLARTYTSLDDLEHYQTTRLTLPMRKGLRELGHRLVRRGVLSDPMDIFFARLADLSAAVEQDSNALWDALSVAVRDEKQAYLAHRATAPDWVLGEVSSEFDSADGLTGLPGSPGVAQGSVFLVLSSDDFPKFPKGAVLVARTTNPAWTPLFYSACAVVTESGGPLSHGAVTAREMQIPAVMSVHGVLSALKNGQQVRVDGAAGKVVVLD